MWKQPSTQRMSDVVPSEAIGVFEKARANRMRSVAVQLAGVCLLALTMVTATATTSAAQNGATVIGPTEDPIAGANPCTGEGYAGTVRTHLVLYGPRFDTAGGMHSNLRVIMKAQALSLVTSRQYQANSEEGIELNVPSSGSAETTVVRNYVLIRQGEDRTATLITANGDDFVFKQTFHVTVNAQGIVTASFDHQHESSCAGPPLAPFTIVIP
jgi:hypothetical protein